MSAAEQEIAHGLRQIEQTAVTNFPEIIEFVRLSQKDPAAAQQALVTWAEANPEKAAALAQMDAVYRQAQQQSASIAQYRQQEQQAEFARYGKAEDAKFEASHPELADQAKRRAVQDDAVAMFEERGLEQARMLAQRAGEEKIAHQRALREQQAKPRTKRIGRVQRHGSGKIAAFEIEG
jgi:hypothetical protein